MDLERKQILVKRLLETVKTYEELFGGPIPYRIVSQRFAQVTRVFGGLDLFLKELQCDGSLTVELLPSGARTLTVAHKGDTHETRGTSIR